MDLQEATRSHMGWEWEVGRGGPPQSDSGLLVIRVCEVEPMSPSHCSEKRVCSQILHEPGKLRASEVSKPALPQTPMFLMMAKSKEIMLKLQSSLFSLFLPDGL
jgi:hypothetical protein